MKTSTHVRPLRKFSLLIAVLFLLAACSPAATALPTPTTAPTEPVAAEPTPTTESLAEPGYPAVGEPTRAPEPVSPYPPPTSGGTRTFIILPEETTAQYSIDEIFINQNNKLATAVGVTSQVSGEMTLNYADPASSSFGEFTVDISTLTSDSSRRDNAIRGNWLESSRFPIARFVVTAVEDFPADPQEGQEITFRITGDMTIKETTRQQTWEVKATLNGDRLTGVATTFLMLADYNIPVPSIAGILKVTDGATITLNFVFSAAQ